MDDNLEDILIKYKITNADCEYYMIYNSIIINVRKNKETKNEYRKQFSNHRIKFNRIENFIIGYDYKLENFNDYMIFIKLTLYDMSDEKIGDLEDIPLENFIQIYNRHLLIKKI